jgi:hypothetical protein
MSEEASQAVYFKISAGREIVKIMACTNAVGEIYFANIFLQRAAISFRICRRFSNWFASHRDSFCVGEEEMLS